MKRISILLLLTTLSIFVLGQQTNTIPVKSKVDEVKLYLGGAQITRIVNVNLPKGTSTIVFKELPSTLDASTFAVEGVGNFTILAISDGFSTASPKLPKEARILQDSLTLLLRQKEDVEWAQSVLDEEEKFLNLNRSIGGQQTGINATELKNATDFYRARLGEIKKGQLANRRKITELNKEIERLKARLYPYTSERVSLNQELSVTVSAERSVSANLKVTYYTTAASWSPLYDIRTDGFGEPVTLILKASARNITGEDWSNTKLTFSTGRPTVGATPPTIYPWFLRPAPPPPPPALESVRIRGRSESAFMMAEESLDDFAASTADISVRRDALTATDYEVPVKYNLVTGKDPLIVEIDKQLLEATYEYMAIPKISSNVYLLAKIANTEQLNLLSAKASIYLEGAFTGSASINPSMATDTLSLPLGVDNAIRVERVRTKDYKSKRFIGSKVSETVGWDINIRNGKIIPIEIKVVDQIPVSADRNIQVSAENLSEGSLNSETGLINWKLKLDSSESKTLRLGYKVEYSKDTKIVLE